MGEQHRLPISALFRHCREDRWEFETTREVGSLEGTVGQSRAVKALDFGIDVAAPGYNLFAVGSPGLGKHSVIEKRLKKAACTKDPGGDWSQIYNFDEPRHPGILPLPAGRGRELDEAMGELVRGLEESIPAALRGEDFQTSSQVIEEEFRRRQDEALEKVREQAREHDIAVIRTPSGVVMAPMEDGEVVGPVDFQDRPEEQRNRFEQRLRTLHRELESTMTRLPEWERMRQRELARLEEHTVRAVAGQEMMELRAQFAGLPEVQQYLARVEDDVVARRADFVSADAAEANGGFVPQWMGSQNQQDPDWRNRYRVNVLVDRHGQEGAPVVREHHPTLENLVGRIDHRARFGALSTDFSMIRPGALHRANGGFLIIDARDVLRQPLGWDQLKRMMRSCQIRIESPAQMLGLVSTVTMEPEPIPLDVKVVLVGDRMIFEILQQLDPDFEDLFKVVVDFEDDTPREADDAEGVDRFVRLLAGLIEKAQLRPFDRGAVARIVEEASRMAGDARRVSLRVEALGDLCSEADHFAGKAGGEHVEAHHVAQAIEARRQRRGRLQDRRLESIARGEVVVDTRGEAIGQINGLSVVTQGGYRFGMPSRITASVRLGRGEFVDIDREVEMSGPIHSKGVLILSGYLGMTFGMERPLSLSASLVFEQSYGRVDGDSASLAEVVALLSALASVPARQELAITGAIDQRGNVQAVGGINEKVEGFFDVCTRLGRTGPQGVIIPRANQEHLMLRRDVVEAVEADQFCVYAVDRVEEAASLLMGIDAGARDETGAFDAQTLYGKVALRLDEFARAALRWAPTSTGLR